MRLELTEQQRQAINAQRQQGAEAVEFGDPASNDVYVLIPRTQYEQLRSLRPSTPAELVIAPGILRSQQAFRRDLPELLAQKKWLGKWVCYRGDERIGIASSMSILMRECLKRGWDDDEFIITIIEPQGLIEEEELDPPNPSHMVEKESQP
jgi:hypothetical protein